MPKSANVKRRCVYMLQGECHHLISVHRLHVKIPYFIVAQIT